MNKHVLVLGLGISGFALVRWCRKQGATVFVADSRETPPLLINLEFDFPEVQFLCHPLDDSLLENREFQKIYKSPGLSPLDIYSLNIAANKKGIVIEGELTVFLESLEELKLSKNYHPKLLAITGTNGKTTVTALTGKLVERAGLTVAVAGNIGPSLLDELGNKLENNYFPAVWVLEVSSFQLHEIKCFNSTAAAVLNITEDHLDWHQPIDGDRVEALEEYKNSKANIFRQTSLMVLNRDDPKVMEMLPSPNYIRQKKIQPRSYITFGSNVPDREGDFGLEKVNGMVWLVRAVKMDVPKKSNSQELPEVYLQRLMPADALRIRGRHNATNALASLALATAAGCTLGPMLYGLREYMGELHRMTSVAILNEVEYFDDSKGTNVGATIAALQSLGEDRDVVLILGGVGKGQNFLLLKPAVISWVKAVILIGRDAGKIRDALESTFIDLHDAENMGKAVLVASQLAEPGDVVLMSPACASFDMFKDYKHRADMFAEAVHELVLEAGVHLEHQT